MVHCLWPHDLYTRNVFCCSSLKQVVEQVIPEHVATVWYLSMLELLDFDNIHPLIAVGQKIFQRILWEAFCEDILTINTREFE